MDILNNLRERLFNHDPASYIDLQDKRGLTPFLHSLQLATVDAESALSQAVNGATYDYLHEVLMDEFEGAYNDFRAIGILTYELVNLTSVCAPEFEAFGFPENEDSRMLRYAIIGTIDQYLKGGTPDGV